MEAGYSLVLATPSIEDYLRLRRTAGLSPKSIAAAAAGLPNTVFGVTVVQSSRAIAMGRVIGDGGLFFQVVDIAVEPEHQRRGVGKRIIGAIVAHLQKTLPSGAYVSLLADGEAHRLYSQFGFTLTAPRSVGMSLSIA